MMVALRVARPVRAWHRRLIERLEASGITLKLEFVGGGRIGAAGFVLAAERRLYRGPSSRPVTAVKAVGEVGHPTITIALDGGGDTAGPALEPFFDGRPGEAALTRALLQGRAPRITIRARPGGEILAAGLPAIEDPGSLTRSMHQVFARLGTLLIQALLVQALGRPAEPSSQAALVECAPEESPEASSAAWFLARGIAGKLGRRLGPAQGRPDHWQIGYRLAGGAGVARTLAWPGAPYIQLPDDGERFFADPFPFEHEERRFLFFEDFPYTSRKGVISLVEIDAEGRVSPPRIVLQQPVHLSYPVVMRHDGGIVMLPEMSGARRVQLFRADPFPDRWVASEILLDDVVAADATPIWHRGRFWLFATLSDDGGSSWDQLGLFHAPALTGPWRPHRDNPVLIDAGAARPAGAMWHEDGVLMRVAQDCRGGYGAGLAICRVDRLDDGGFSQTVVARLSPPAGARGVHTLNRCGALEVIDLKVDHPRGLGLRLSPRPRWGFPRGPARGSGSPPARRRRSRCRAGSGS